MNRPAVFMDACLTRVKQSLSIVLALSMVAGGPGTLVAQQAQVAPSTHPGRAVRTDMPVPLEQKPPVSLETAPPPVPANAAPDEKVANTAPSPVTPIQHVIIIIGENRSFDHVFATYVPKGTGQTINNLLSEGIITATGAAGPNHSVSNQYSASDTSTFLLSPGSKAVYTNIPEVLTGSAPESASNSDPAPFKTVADAEEYEPDLPSGDYTILTTGATGIAEDSKDTRITNDTTLGSGVFQLTPSVTYDDYAASPVHRFYQMWQQNDCSTANVTASNPSGCLHDLYPWVEVSVGTGSDGDAQPKGFSNTTTGEGSAAMPFYNMQSGDVPYFKSLADTYTISDNFHQSVMGGTGANHIMFGFGDAIWYSNGSGSVATPPSAEIENPNPQSGTNDYYTQDGYSGGSYTNCSDTTQPGVSALTTYLASLSPAIKPNCAANTYYLLNNYNPGYVGSGALETGTYTIPPVSIPHIGDVMSAAGLSWTYFGEGWNTYVKDPNDTNEYDVYCNICNPFQYATDIMTSSTQIAAHIQDTSSFLSDVSAGTLPAVSIIKPDGYVDGHPASSKLDLFEAFVQDMVTAVQANSTLWANTAIFITFDESGGFYDSGYIQPVDYFGDGPRIPLLIVSPYSEGGIVNHSYGDHVSLDKFIERNWNLGKISTRSRDNFPNPVTSTSPYIPTNNPALDDLFDAFNFSSFSLSASPTAVSVAQGAKGTSTITSTVVGSYDSAVALTASGAPTGVTVSFSPTSIAAPGSGTSTMGLSVASTTAVGTYPITVTGTGGGLTETTTVNLTVTGNGFSLSSSPASVTVVQGNSGTSTITSAVTGSFSSAVALSASGQPTGVTASFSPASIAAPGSGTSVLTLTVASTTAVGTYPITVTGTGGGLTMTATVSLTVTTTSSNLVLNGGFETGTFADWTAAGTTVPTVSTAQKHSGSYSAFMGSTKKPEVSGDSSVSQVITIPSTATSATLTFWYYAGTTDTITYAYQEALIENSSGTVVATPLKVASNTKAWTEVTYSLNSYIGQTITLYFAAHGNAYASDYVYMYLDDVAVNIVQ